MMGLHLLASIAAAEAPEEPYRDWPPWPVPEVGRFVSRTRFFRERDCMDELIEQSAAEEARAAAALAPPLAAVEALAGDLPGPLQLAARAAGAGASVAGASAAAAGPSTRRRNLERLRALRLAECCKTSASLPADLLDRVLFASVDPNVQGEVGRTSLLVRRVWLAAYQLPPLCRFLRNSPGFLALQAGVCRGFAQTSAPSGDPCGRHFGVNATVNAYKQAVKRGDLTRRFLLEADLMEPFCSKCMKLFYQSIKETVAAPEAACALPEVVVERQCSGAAGPLPEHAGASAQREGAFTLTHYEVAQALTHLPSSRCLAPG